MKPLRESIEEYVAMRRALGFKLREDGVVLADFATFMEQHGADRITIRLALAWAQAPQATRPAYWAARLRFVRGSRVTTSQSILAPKFRRSICCLTGRSARVPTSTRTRKSSACSTAH